MLTSPHNFPELSISQRKSIEGTGCLFLNDLDGNLAHNDPVGHLSHDATSKFIHLLKNEVDTGHGFIPFVGAGLSAPSGVPLLWELKPYLQRCLGIALSVTNRAYRPWNPRTDLWPPFLPEHFNDPPNWRSEFLDRLSKEEQFDRYGRNAQILEESLGALAEWRTGLSFLSRLNQELDPSDEKQVLRLLLEEPRSDIIDSFFRTVLKGKRPTLGHRMLAALGGVLRLDLLITTNFDDLLEEAFSDARNPLVTYDVHLEDGLPAISAVSTQRSLIKLHGDRHSLRADYSLDAPASFDDRTTFVKYLKGSDNTSPPTRNQLFVMGCSASERRTASLIEHAWTQLGDSFRVYWLCYSNSDVKGVIRLTKGFKDHLPKHLQDDSRKEWCGSIVLRHTNPGLLFLQTAQSFRATIPVHGVQFPSTSRLCRPPLSARSGGEPSRSECRQELLTRIERLAARGMEKSSRLAVVTSENNSFGVTSICAECFEELETRYMCIWLDMNDISSTDDLFEQLLDAMYHRLGSESWLPVYVAKDAPAQGEEIRRLAAFTTRPWIVFINARETPGANYQVKASEKDLPPNGWIDDDTPNSDNEQAGKHSFVSLLKQLCPENAGDPSLTIVLLCRSEKDSASSPVIRALQESDLLRGQANDVCTISSGSINATQPGEVARKCLAWTRHVKGENKSRKRFLTHLVLMQRTRFPVSISAILPNRDDVTETWLKELESLGLVRRKLGGFIWLHSDARNRIRKRLDDAILEAELHWKIAQWYYRVLASSLSPYAIFEAVHHACSSAEAIIRSNGSITVAEDRLHWATNCLKSNSFIIQTLGYSRGTCRRLDRIRKELVKQCFTAIKERYGENSKDSQVTSLWSSLQDLRITATELMRAVAREVGEIETAYARHREVRSDLSSATTVADRDSFIGHLIKSRSPQTAIEWVRWNKWCGMLGIAARSFERGSTALFQGLRSVGRREALATEKDVISYLKTTEKELDEAFADHIRDLSSDPNRREGFVLGIKCEESYGRLSIEVVRCIEQFIACRLHQFSINKRASISNYRQEESRQFTVVDLDSIHSIAEQGLELATTELRPGRATAILNWCRCRLMLHQGQLAGFMGNYEKAMTLFNDAEAALNLGDLGRFESDRAIVELYRADAKLGQADNLEIIGSESLSSLIRRYMKGVGEQQPVEWNNRMTEEFPNQSESGELDELTNRFRRSRELVRDSIRFLVRAEDIFSRKRRNSAWTTWYLHRRLYSIGLSVWTSLLEPEIPIPYLGPEASPEPATTLADQILHQSVRLIRNDAYRLATIVDSYAMCAVGLTAFLRRNTQTLRLSNRRRMMQNTLNNSVSILEEVFARRKGGRPKNIDKEANYKLDDSVHKYIEDTIKNSKKIANSLRQL